MLLGELNSLTQQAFWGSLGLWACEPWTRSALHCVECLVISVFLLCLPGACELRMGLEPGIGDSILSEAFGTSLGLSELLYGSSM